MKRCHPPQVSAARWRLSSVRAWLAPLILFLAILAVPTVPAETPAPAPQATDPVALDKKLIEEAKTTSEIMANLTQLSDGIGARLTGSPALKKANEWAADKMKSYGLTDVHLEGWTIPVGWERGTATMRVVEPAIGPPMTVAAMGWTPSTKGKVIGEVVILNAKNSKDLAAYKGKLKNAIVLQGKPSDQRPVTETNLFGGGGPGGRKGRGGPGGATPDAKTNPDAKPGDKAAPKADAKTDPKVEEKANARTNPNPPAKTEPKPGEKAEAKGGPGGPGGPGGGPGGGGGGQMRFYQQMMAFRKEVGEFLHAEGAAVRLMDSDKPHGLLNMTGNWPGEDRVSGAEPLPTLFVVHEAYAQLYRMATHPGSTPPRVEVEIRNTLTPGPIAVYNTIGEIKGSEKPDEYVVLGAHIDSWDLGQGTTDNGTGTCVVLEAARILAKCGVKPKRTIRFCLFSGEEQGLYGSRAFVKKHAAEMAKTSMALVHDTGTGKVQGIGLEGRASVKPILEPELVSLKELGCTDINLQSMGGSDHMSFESAGVPGFAVQQDWDEYRFTHHSQSDTLDKAKESSLIQGAQVLAITAMRVANLPNLLPHDKPPRRSPFDPAPANDPKVAAKDSAGAPAGKEAAPAKPAAPKPAAVLPPKAPGNQ
jgi:carboxypeptidase Q